MRSPTLAPTLDELAQQIGLADSPSSPPLSLTDGAAVAGEAEPLSLDDYFEPEVEPPETFTTRPAFYNTGLSKAALVGGVGLVLFLGGASLFKVASPTGQTQTAMAEAEAEAVPEDPTLVALRQSQAAESRAKAKLALLEQREGLAEASGEADPKEESGQMQATASNQPPSTPNKPIAKAQPTPIASPAPSPPARLTPAPTYSTVRPKPTVASPAPMPRLSPGLSQRLTTPARPAVSHTTAPVKALDPMAEWQRLASLGSYGQVNPGRDASAAGGDGDANATVAALFPGASGWGSSPEAIQVETPASTPSPQSLGTSPTAAPLSDYFGTGLQPVARWESMESAPSEATFLAQAQRTILVGSSGQGHLVTPVLWAPDGSRGEARFIVALSQPIADAQGQPALPEGTQFVVAAQNLDPESGLVDLSVTALLIDGQEYEAPEGIFSVRDRQGGLLLGELRNRPNQGRGDFARIATGALAQVGKLMNRPRSTSTSTTNGSFGSSQSSTTQNDDPNYVGAVLEGGFDEFASVIEERQQAAAQALAKAPQLYQLKAGHPIQIFINQSLSL